MMKKLFEELPAKMPAKILGKKSLKPISYNTNFEQRRKFFRGMAAVAVPFVSTAGTASVLGNLLVSPAAAGTSNTQVGTQAGRDAAGQTTGQAAGQAQQFGPDRILPMINIHTGETYEDPYWSSGRYIESSLSRINSLMRDHRANEVMKIDLQVIDFLYKIYNSTGNDKPMQILSGYRSPATNAKLAARSSGVAKNSLHMVGKAIDFRMPGYSTRKLQKAALQLHRGGVGFYAKSDFIHIDSGPFRHWE